MLHVSSSVANYDSNPTFWMIECPDVIQPKTEESEKDFLERYQQSCIKQEEDGAYCVKFPWKCTPPVQLQNL